MTRQEEILNYANSFQGKGMENEELKETIRLAIIDGAMWADDNPNINAFIEKVCKFLKSYRQDTPDGTGYIAGIVNDKTIEDFKTYMKGE